MIDPRSRTAPASRGRSGPALGAPAALILLALGTLGAPAAAQDPPPVPPPMPGGPATTDAAVSSLVPGELPAGTSQAARELWQRLADATLPHSDEQRRIRGFQLRLDLAINNGLQHNEIKATYSYMRDEAQRRSYVRAKLASGRMHLRGPAGDYLVDRGGEVTRLVGRDFEEDRRTLDQTQSIARNFIAFTDPGRLRLARLEKLEGPPRSALASESKEVREAAEELEWLELWTPDLAGFAPPVDDARPNAGSKAGGLVEARIGIQPKTGLAELCVIGARNDERPGRDATLLHLRKYASKDGFRIPQLTYVFQPNPKTGLFARKETTSFWVILRESTLRKALAPEDFTPPK